MIFDHNTGILRVGQDNGKVPEATLFPAERDSLYRLEHQAFFEAAAGLRSPESSASEAIVSMAVIEAALDSLELRKRVPITFAET